MVKMGFFHPHICFLAFCAALSASPAAFAQFSAFEDPASGMGVNNVAGAQEFGPAKPDIDGGDIPQGQTNQLVILLRNNTGAPIIAQAPSLIPSSNVTATVTSDLCSKNPVKPGVECALTMSIKGESQGNYRVGVLVKYGENKISSIGISGNIVGAGGGQGGMPANEIDAFPANLDFGTTKGRTPLVRSISLRNSSTRALDISGIELAASPLTGFSVSAPNCKVLESSQSCVATVTWTPTVEGKAEGVLVLRHTGPSGSLQIPLTGEYETVKTEKASLFPSPISGQGLVVADRDSVDFGSGVDGAASITVSLINTGDKEVVLNQVKLAGSDNGLSLSGDGCINGKVLEPNAGCALTVNWLARRKGPVIDDIQIIHTGARGVLVLPVRGTATETVNLNMPLLNMNELPKIGKGDLDESMLGSKAAETSKTASSGAASFGSSDASALNGYRVTSLSASSAVITGPRGRIVVNDGTSEIIAGGHWTPRVIAEGVELRGDKGSVLLLFDRSLGMINPVSSKGIFNTASTAIAAPRTAAANVASTGNADTQNSTETQ